MLKAQRQYSVSIILHGRHSLDRLFFGRLLLIDRLNVFLEISGDLLLLNLSHLHFWVFILLRWLHFGDRNLGCFHRGFYSCRDFSIGLVLSNLSFWSLASFFGHCLSGILESHLCKIISDCIN